MDGLMPLFQASVPKSFCSNASSYVCSALLRVIRHFSWLGTFYGRLLWHFFGACIFLVGCLCTLGQKLAGKVYVGNSRSPVNDKNSVRTSGLGPWFNRSFLTRYHHHHLTRTMRYQEGRRVSIYSLQLLLITLFVEVLRSLILSIKYICISMRWYF